MVNPMQIALAREQVRRSDHLGVQGITYVIHKTANRPPLLVNGGWCGHRIGHCQITAVIDVLTSLVSAFPPISGICDSDGCISSIYEGCFSLSFSIILPFPLTPDAGGCKKLP